MNITTMSAFRTLCPLGLILTLALAGSVKAQTHFYINSIAVGPIAPTTSDQISISLIGDLSSTGAFIASVNHTVIGNTVQITVNAADPGGSTVLVPHTETIDIGQLPAGSYTIEMNGVAVLDLAPQPDHQFVVSAGGGPTCDDLTIASIQWSTFTDTAITVHVLNNEVGFDHPGFILFDANGDTLAIETVYYFAIAAESWHLLTIHPDAEVPPGPFNGTLELWTGFFTELACTWEVEVDLCPSDDCVTIQAYVANFGNSLVTGSFDWAILGEGDLVASGTFDLDPEQQMDTAHVCLPPSSYQLVVTPLQGPIGGQLVMGVADEPWEMDVQQPLPQGIPTAPLDFDVFPACFEGPNTVQARPLDGGLLDIRSYDGGIDVCSTSGEPLGTISLFDASGRTIFQTRTSNSRIQLPPVRFGLYLLTTDVARGSVLIGER